MSETRRDFNILSSLIEDTSSSTTILSFCLLLRSTMSLVAFLAVIHGKMEINYTLLLTMGQIKEEDNQLECHINI